MTISELLDNILKEINNVNGIEASAIASRDGLLIYSVMSEKRANKLAALSAAMMGAAESASLELGTNSVDRLIAESNKGKIIVISAGSEALLIGMTQPDVYLGLILIDMINASEKIKNALH
jgi:predicted regulator of Ras-like GTPase activity (Roadblock/LC7/MglB family)